MLKLPFAFLVLVILLHRSLALPAPPDPPQANRHRDHWEILLGTYLEQSRTVHKSTHLLASNSILRIMLDEHSVSDIFSNCNS